MTLDLNNAAANYALDQLYDNKFPAGSKVQARTGSGPGAENAASGTLLAEVTTPASPWAAASSGSKAKQNTWATTGAASGTAGHVRMKDSGDTMREDGTAGATGSGADWEFDNTSIASSQAVAITAVARTL